MKCWNYFHNGQVLMESEIPRWASEFPVGTYLYNTISGNWARTTAKVEFELVQEEDVPPEYRVLRSIL